MTAALDQVMAAYRDSDAALTRALYARLETLGPVGTVAVNLYRAQKASERAKLYRGGDHRGSYRHQAYDRKQWALDQLCQALSALDPDAALTWGWGLDPAQPLYPHVLYVDLPTGQVSFHAPARGAGPAYDRPWDGIPGQSPDRIIRYLARLLAGASNEEAA